MIKAERISFSYQQDGPQALRDIDIEIAARSWVAIIGANGSGKSTLARHFNGLLLPDKGRVLVDGLDTADADELIEVRQKVAFVFQNPDNQMVATSVEDDIAFGPENLGLPPQEIGRRLTEALAITGLTDKRRQAPHLLSGGEKQRVAIAGALAMRSAYMVLDEPTSMLDPQLRLSVIATLRKLHRELGLTIIYVTNVMEEALLAERVLVLETGQLVKDGPPAEIFSDAKWLQKRQLALPPACQIAAVLAEAGCKELAGCLTVEDLLKQIQRPEDRRQRTEDRGQRTEDRGQRTDDEGRSHGDVGRDDHGAPIAQPVRGDRPIIETRRLCFAYRAAGLPSVDALVEVDLEIAQGEIVGLIGHSGSGKSTLAQLLTGLIMPISGEVFVGGVSNLALPKGAIFRSAGLVFQYPEQQLFAETVAEEVAFGARNFGMFEQKLPKVVENALREVGLPPQEFLQRSPFALSGGQKRRLCIACVLAMNTKILIFDEPTAGLDEGGRQWMLQLARRLQGQGKTIVWISHNMEEVAELAGRIIVLHQGRVVKDGPPAAVFAAAEELSNLGLDIPVAAKLVRQGKTMGLPLPGKAITVAGACQELLKLLDSW
jgi:energy-coupling factor transport system ATP-binding protein